MNRFQRMAVLAVVAGWSFSFGQGGGAIITLVMPPPGGDGYSILQAGGAVPTGAASIYYNPALLSGLQGATGSQGHFTRSNQDLLPALGVPNLDQNYGGAAFSLSGVGEAGFDIGVGFFRNHVDFGPNLGGSEDSTDPFHASETVYGVGAGVRVFGPLSVGATAKYYESRLGASAEANGWAFDVGALALHRFEPLSFKGIRSLTVTPSFGYAWQNLGADAAYTSASGTDPLPRTERTSLALQAGALDMAQVTWGHDWERETHRRASRSDPAVRTYGYSWSILAYRFSKGWLKDSAGERDEIHTTDFAVELNALQFWRAWQRMKTSDFTSASSAMEAGYPFARIRILGVSYRFNPRFTAGRRVIRSHDGGLRDGQEADYWSISL